jgi:FlaA1/EpsC-like NDP-sugar epimerase
MNDVLLSRFRSLAYFVGRKLNEFFILRQTLKVLWHLVGVPLAYWYAYVLRFDGNVPDLHFLLFVRTVPILMIVCLVVFFALRDFSGLWTYFSVGDVFRLAGTLALALGLFYGISCFGTAGLGNRVPRSVVLLTFMLLSGWLGMGRMGARYLKRFRGVPTLLGGEELAERMLLVGRLADADLVIRESRHRDLGVVVGVVSDEAQAHNTRLHGVRVFHQATNDIGLLASQLRPDSILLLPPFNRPRQINEIMEKIAEAGVTCAFRTVPSLSDLASGQLSASSIRSVDIEDLLERGQVTFDRADVRKFLKGKTVMITGAGGSIGSELSRQVAGYEPGCLVLFDHSEFGLYSIEQEIDRQHPNLRILAIAGDVQRAESVRRAFREAGGVDVVYHAAAYKHVPLMEKNVPACFRANVLGTACLAAEAVAAGVDRFVMISSDKAVRPTSIMGVTKRMAERVINEMDAGKTTFVSVRFGNVLGSSGSVVPLFKNQIAAGGPVTVTSQDMRRFFMTIPEAVDLVLQAGTVGRHREIMVLEMGEEIRIADLARRLIELSGLVPDKDIKIEFTGLRPGEKEFEEIMTEDENVAKTAFDKIYVMTKNTDAICGSPVDMMEIGRLVLEGDGDGLRRLAARCVPDNLFAPPASDG